MSEISSISSDKKYLIDGQELIKLDRRLGSVYGDLKWARDFIRTALDGMTSHDDECFPRFVAKIGILLGNMNEIVTSFSNLGLTKLGAGMQAEEADSEKQNK